MATTVLSTESMASGYRARRQPERIVVPEIDLTLDSGELVCLLGPNGVGKSTLLRTISGVQPALAGQVSLVGDPLHRIDRVERTRRLATVLTERITVGQLAGYDLVALGRHPHTGWGGRLNAHDHQVVSDAIVAVGATHLAHRHVDELSDGERQRLMIARALAQEPKVLILDEPTAFLDATSRIELGTLLQRLAHQRGLGVICSTHDLDLALATADTVWLLEPSGEIQIGSPEDLSLSGALGEVFSSDDLTFDIERGTFSRRPSLNGRAVVEGDGLSAVLCARALTRVGFEVVHGEHCSTPDVTVAVTGNAYDVSVSDGSSVHCTSIRDVCRHIADQRTLSHALADF